MKEARVKTESKFMKEALGVEKRALALPIKVPPRTKPRIPGVALVWSRGWSKGI